MKRLIFFLILAFSFFKFTAPVLAADTPTPPIICGCPAVLNTNIYTNSSRADGGGQCVTDMQTFQQDPAKNHLWVEDPEITTQGKADERARQFLFWVFRTGTIDNHPTLIRVWSFARNVTVFLLFLIAAVMGIGIIVGQRTNFTSSIKIWPQITRLLMLLLYVAFSSVLVIGLIQLSDVMMKFFIERLGGGDLLNINFGVVSGEENYIRFIGCRDLNIRVQEAAKTEVMMLHLTNMTYYVMGVMLILRKILLWFLLFVSPFLALLLPFVFIRNIGWIWIGVFFQWLFYGPLFALFLGGLTNVWKSGIPFIFDFSRVGTDSANCNPAGYVYPTAINILYGGPAQKLAICNNANYVDTFAEYIISLIMLWAVIFFPWWLLRIFRDYCCEGILAVKNILLSMYDQIHGGPSPQTPGLVSTGPFGSFGTALKMPKEVEGPVRVKLETVEEIKKAKTEEITRSLNLNVSKLTDIARFETSKEVRQSVQKNLTFLQNPTKAETPNERQKYMNIRSELFNRAIKEDKSAKQILSSISTSRFDQIEKREELIKSISQVPITRVISIKISVPQEKIRSASTSFFNFISQNSQIVKNIAQTAQLDADQTQTILDSFKDNQQSVKKIDERAAFIARVAQQTGIDKQKIAEVAQLLQKLIEENKTLVDQVAKEQNIKQEQAVKIISDKIPAEAPQAEVQIERSIPIPPSISLEEYEQVKKMWKNQYERGEVPLSDMIKTRDQWIKQDVVYITNILNKLVSDLPEIRQQGLGETGLILPIFLINNLKGEQLLVYLKAKLEAAKEIQSILEAKEEAKEEVKAEKEEEFVDVEKPKAEEKEKVMQMKAEIKDETKPEVGKS